MTSTSSRPVVLAEAGRSQVVEVPCTPAEVMRRVLRGAYRIAGTRVIDRDMHAGIMVIRTGTTIWS